MTLTNTAPVSAAPRPHASGEADAALWSDLGDLLRRLAAEAVHRGVRLCEAERRLEALEAWRADVDAAVPPLTVPLPAAGSALSDARETLEQIDLLRGKYAEQGPVDDGHLARAMEKLARGWLRRHPLPEQLRPGEGDLRD